MSFTDYKTGKYYADNAQFYWKPLSEMFFDFVNHKEDKYNGDIGALTRQKITLDNVIHIGKESNNLEGTEALGVSDNDYVIYDNASDNEITLRIMNSIKNMTPEQAKQTGISKRNLQYLRKKVKNGTQITLKRKTLYKLNKMT
jgi:DNA-binding Xre family transcriptional regulator